MICRFSKETGVISLVYSSVQRSKKAIDAEILRQCAEFDKKNEHELDALILWVLHEKFAFGKKRLRRFYDSFAAELDELVKRYELGDEDRAWLCTYKLKQCGIDIAAWNEEDKNEL